MFYNLSYSNIFQNSIDIIFINFFWYFNIIIGTEYFWDYRIYQKTRLLILEIW